jgi:dUTP pyrophosphatase
MYLKYKKLREGAKTPARANYSDAGMDLFWCPDAVEKASGVTEVWIKPGESVKLGTGISVEIPHGYMLLGLDKSGIASNKHLLLGGGVCDPGYSGELIVNLNNTNRSQQQHFKEGDKIAQIVLVPIVHFNLIEADSEEELYTNVPTFSTRKDGGFGSTGAR